MGTSPASDQPMGDNAATPVAAGGGTPERAGESSTQAVPPAVNDAAKESRTDDHPTGPTVRIPVTSLVSFLVSSPVVWRPTKELTGQTDADHLRWLTFDPDGRLLASCSGDTVRIWDIAAGKTLSVLEGGSKYIGPVSFTPDGEAVVGRSHKMIKLWDTATGTVLRALEGRNASFSPDGRMLALNGELWDVATGKKLRELDGPAWFSPQGEVLASYGADKTIKLWDVTTGAHVRTLSGQLGSPSCLAFNQDGKMLATAAYRQAIKLWDISTGTELRALKGGPPSVTHLTFSPDGRILASRGRDMATREWTICIWDVTTGTELHKLEERKGLGDCSMGFSPDGKMLTFRTDRMAVLWDVATGKQLCELEGRVWLSPDGEVIASQAPREKKLKLWEVRTGRALRSVETASSLRSSDVCFSPDGRFLVAPARYRGCKLWEVATGRDPCTLSARSPFAFNSDGTLLATGSFEKAIRIWQVSTGPAVWTLGQHAEGVGSMCFSPDGETLAWAGRDRTIRLWDIVVGAELCTLHGHRYSINAVTFSPDGLRLASGGIGQVKLWDLKARAVRWEGRHSANAVSFSADGKVLASGGNYSTISLWDAGTGAELHALTGHTGNIRSLSFSPDGKTLASAGGKEIKLWDVATGAERCTLQGEDRCGQNAVCFSPDGRLLASGNSRGTVTLWSAVTRSRLHILKTSRRGSMGIAQSLSFSPDGSVLAWGSYDGRIKLWDVTTYEPLHTLGRHTGAVSSVSFRPDGRMLASGGDKVRLWPLPRCRPLHVALYPRARQDTVAEQKLNRNAVDSFLVFYVDLWRKASLANADDLRPTVKQNREHARLFVDEMLREYYWFPDSVKLKMAEFVANLIDEQWGDGAAAATVQSAKVMGRAQMLAHRGLTFRGAAHVFSRGTEREIHDVARAAPQYADLFVRECLMRQWAAEPMPSSSEHRVVSEDLGNPTTDHRVLAKRVAQAYKQIHGDSWIMTATEDEGPPGSPVDREHMESIATVAMQALRHSTRFDTLGSLRQSVHVRTAAGAYEEAIRTARWNACLAEAFGSPRARIEANVDLAEAHRALGDYEAAKKRVAQATALARQASDKGLQAEALLAQAHLMVSSGHHEQASAVLRQATDVAREADDSAMLFRCTAWLALSLARDGQHVEAASMADLAINGGQQGEDASAGATALYARAQAHFAAGQYGDALEVFMKVAEFEEDAKLVMWRRGALFHVGRCYEQMATEAGISTSKKRLCLARAARGYEEAVASAAAQRGMLVQEHSKALFGERQAALYEALVRVHLKLGQHTRAITAAERCKAMAFFERLTPRSVERRIAQLTQRRRKLTDDLQAVGTQRRAQVAGAKARELAKLTANIRVAALRCDVALKRLDQQDWSQVRDPRRLAVKTLPPKSIALEYFLGDRLAVAFALSQSGVRSVELGVKPDHVAKLIDDFRTSAVDVLTEEKLRDGSYRRPLSELYRILIQPFEDDLAQADTVCVIPHGVLHYLPFQALLDENGSYLIERANVVYTPSLNVLGHCREANMGNKENLLAVANPQTEWDPLPATEREADAISEIFGGRFGGRANVVKGAEATERLVKETAGQFDVLTFPTHGEMVWQDPTKSNLRFTRGHGEDGKLTVEEIFNMDLKANLVALSACETGLAGGYGGKLPQADDFVGLTRAFMFAGVPSVVGSLWKVADDSAVALMTAFFTNWKQKGMNKAEALREAQLAMIRGDVKLGMVVRGPGGVAQVDAGKVQAGMETNLGRHPYFWAPFVLIGDYK